MQAMYVCVLVGMQVHWECGVEILCLVLKYWVLVLKFIYWLSVETGIHLVAIMPTLIMNLEHAKICF